MTGRSSSSDTAFSRFFRQAWREAGRPPSLRVATVGGGTSAVLASSCGEGAPQAAFTPARALASALASELPRAAAGAATRVLYPASLRAGGELAAGLAARSTDCSAPSSTHSAPNAPAFELTRLDTYDTRPVEAVDVAALRDADGARCVAFGSPSAVKAWVSLCGGAQARSVACIGRTSAAAAVRLGLANLYYPDAPGVAGWADAVAAALRGDPPRDEQLRASIAGSKHEAEDAE